ncbi:MULTISPECIES: DUF2059 domain-containing protein [unclassified Anabaena]|uniref:DUF2059 domain-containing protein n=1 Tax=unclassified Anabaena TaxID=2619674 RepID=UPI0014463CF3|nr:MULTISPECIES: DUF2059 domain-containing protein [unclassified Anabaena]MTJ08347.1 DUF2059 domain-containing protein [Anabaena sp. UHCC 0204]MTJ51554.1 DUF2059 domain-containing protein [Anabaena sp. UHCC 0253]
MQIKTFVFAASLSLLTNFSLPAFAQTPASSIQEAEKINNVKKLLDITGSRNLSRKIITQLIDSLKAEYPQAPAKFWDTFMAELKQDEMIDEYIPIYSKYFTNEEIKGIIAFYETPLGKKTLAVIPQISKESTAIGIRYGKQAAERALEKLKKEGYISPDK